MTVIMSLVELATEDEKGSRIQVCKDNEWVDREYKAQPYEWLCNGSSVRIKPQLKKIDLLCLVGSGVLCEFGNTYKIIGALTSITGGSRLRYKSPSDDGFHDNCRPLFNYWHHHDGGECHIPDGFVVDIKTVDGDYAIKRIVGMSRYDYWDKVIAYRVTGIAEGWEL